MPHVAGANPIHLKRGIDKAVEAAVAELVRVSKKVGDLEEIRQVAKVSANWDRAIGDIIADAMDKVGKDTPPRWRLAASQLIDAPVLCRTS